MDARRGTGADRTRPPGREAPVFPVAAINNPALPEVLAELAAARADEMDADTVNRELSIARKAIGWWQRQGWIECDPTMGIERRPAPPDRTKALAETSPPSRAPWSRLCRRAAHLGAVRGEGQHDQYWSGALRSLGRCRRHVEGDVVNRGFAPVERPRGS
ncbi:hypothetical protein ACWD6R_08175 [Streptomyces sp. NPDC005151]